MCMIVYRPAGGKTGRGPNIPGAVVETALRRHPDGFGIAYRENGELCVQRFGPDGAKRFRKVLKRIDRTHAGEYVAHFRFATHGPKDAAHAHPYEYTHPVDGRVLVFHNGVIDIKTSAEESDTEVFVKLVLARLNSRWWEDPALSYLVNEAIGWSKLTIMTRDGTYNLHEKRGDWDGGIWYSSQHKPVTVTYKAPTPPTPPVVRAATHPVVYASGSSARSTVRDVVSAGSSVSHLLGVPQYGERNQVFRHGGHTLSSVVHIDRSKDGDYQNGVMCDVCYTLGDVYVIDGGVYIDMAHKNEKDPDDGWEGKYDA